MLKNLLFYLILLLFNNISIASSPLLLKYNITSNLSKFDYLYENPAILLLAFENSGIKISSTYMVIIKNNHEFEIGPGSLKFIKNNNNLYLYEASLNSFDSIFLRKLKIYINLDINNLHNGEITISINSSEIEHIPNFIIDKLKVKSESIINENKSIVLLNYLTKSSELFEHRNNQNKLMNKILIDAYNNNSKNSIGYYDEYTGKNLVYNLILFCSILVTISLIFINFKFIKK